MTIRVICTKCHSASEVDDEAAGGEAVCPFCSAVFNVPEQNVPSEEVSVPSTAESVLQYRARQPLTNSPVEWGQIDPKTCCRIAAELYRRHARALLYAHCLVLGASWLLEIWVGVAPATVAGFVQFTAMLAILFLNIGLSLFALHIARGREPDTGTLFAGGNRLIRFLAFNLLFMLLIAIGCLGFIVPGIYFATRFWSAGMFIIDRDCTVFEAFGMASRFSEGNRLPSLMLGFISLALALIGASLLGIGLIFAYPLITMIWVVAYLMLTRQPIERPIAVGAA